MPLSKRLTAVFQMVEQGSTPADIGCDHGLLPISLIQRGVCEKVYACDLREGPLNRAKELIYKEGLQKEIPTLLTNGMDHLPQDVDCIIIAGMGFDTIKMILEAHHNELSKYRKFIIQSNTNVHELRKWISDHEFRIDQEDIIWEGHYYQVVSFLPDKGRRLTDEEILFGLSLRNHPLFQKMWTFRSDKLKQVLKSLPDGHENVNIVQKQIEQIEQALQKSF